MVFLFERLNVYQKALDFVNSVYSATKRFPKEEQFGLSSQLRRAAVSITANIAEGSAKQGKECSRYLDISKGSLFECVALLQVAQKQEFVTIAQYKEFEVQLAEISKMLSGLQNSVKNRITKN